METSESSLLKMYKRQWQDALASWDDFCIAVADFALEFWDKAQDFLYVDQRSSREKASSRLAMSPAKIKIEPAYLISVQAPPSTTWCHIHKLRFEVPLNHEDYTYGGITIAAEQRFRNETDPYFVYLVGGPGSENDAERMDSLSQYLLAKGYQVLFLDYRGTGHSSGCGTLRSLIVSAQKAKHLEYFRQDNIVRDLEAVRIFLGVEKWSLWGQSFGGWVALTYLSFYPESLNQVFLTGGMAPIGKTPGQVYCATYKKVSECNRKYFQEYPEDEALLKSLISKICGRHKGTVTLPNGGLLTVQRLMSLGRSLGSRNGPKEIHDMLRRISRELDEPTGLSRTTGEKLANWTKYDSRPLYAIMHEPIYCSGPGVEAYWAAYRIGRQLEEYRWLKSDFADEAAQGRGLEAPLYFSGEMVYPFLFDVYPGLRFLAGAADELAKKSDWEPLYDEAQLRRNTVPVYAAVYELDMYVDYDLSRETARKIGNVKVVHPQGMYHDAIREQTKSVMDQLFALQQ